MAAMTSVQGYAGPARKAVRRSGVSGLAAALLAAGLLSGCAGRFDGFAPLPAAMQHPYPQSVPQLGRDGTVLAQYDAERSLLPLALAGALVDFSDGARRGFSDAYSAGYNSIVAAPGQPGATVQAAARGSHVLALSDGPPAVPGPEAVDAHAARVIPVGDTAALARLPAAIRQAGGRPVWARLRAHADAAHGQSLPDPQTATLLAFGALAGGATGLLWDGEDNYATRNAGRLGIAAAPSLDYGIRTDPDSGRRPYRATPSDVAASRRLWDAVATLNRRIERLAPMLLRADAPEDLSVATPDGATGEVPAVLALLKPWDDGRDPRRLLLLVNLHAAAVDVRIATGRRFLRVERWQDTDPELPEADAGRGLFRDRLAPLGVRLYRITMSR